MFGGWGMSPAVPTCPNCGSSPFDKEKNCSNCGYEDPKTSKVDEATLVFCYKCGCTFLDACKSHGTKYITKAKT